MSSIEHLAANVIAPIDGRIIVLSGTTTDKLATLSATALFGNDNVDWYRHYITIQPEGGDLWFYLCHKSKTAAGSVNKTITATKAAGTVPWLLKDGQRMDFRIRRMRDVGVAGALTTKLFFLCSLAATKVRLYISSTTASEHQQTG